MKKMTIVSTIALALIVVFIPELPCIPVVPFEGCGPPW